MNAPSKQTGHSEKDGDAGVSERLRRIVVSPYLGVLLGGLAALGFAPLDWWPLTLVAFAWLCDRAAVTDRAKASFTLGWMFAFGYFVVGLIWIATAFTYQAAMPAWLGYAGVLLLSAYLACFPALGLVGARWVVGRKAGRVAHAIALAAMWGLAEWVRSWAFSGFAWNPLAVIAVDIGMAARWIGTYGLSAVVFAAAAGTALLWRRQWLGGVALLVPLAVSALLQFAVPAPVGGPTPAVAIVQPNIDQDQLTNELAEPAHFATLRKFSLPAEKDGGPRIVFWPESPLDDYYEEGYPARFYGRSFYGSPVLSRARVASVLDAQDLLFTGTMELEFAPEKNGFRQLIGARNTVVSIDAAGEMGEPYYKEHLVPYGEYLPMRDVLEPLGMQRLVEGGIDFWPGPGPHSQKLPDRFGRTVGVQVCYEIIFSGQVVDRSNRPDFIFNPSNDAWFGPSGPPQHLAQARLRALEEGLPVVRSTQNGVSALVDSKGRVLGSLPLHKAGVIRGKLPPAAAPQLFALYGNIVPVLLLLFVLAGVAVASRYRDRRKAEG